MTAKEELIKEITQSPDFVIEEVLNFIDDITSQIPQTEWEKLPSDMSQNLDYYLYGSPNSEE